MELFETGSIKLSMRNAESGEFLTANAYTIDGIMNQDGSLRLLSISQLVMAVCLNKAVEHENKIVSKMEGMAQNTQGLEALADIEQQLVDGKARKDIKGSWTIGSKTFKTAEEVLQNYGVSWQKTVNGQTVEMTSEELCEAIESQMDSMNSVAQEDLIELQSLTSKRDDTYSLISNVLKSINTVLIGNANNL